MRIIITDCDHDNLHEEEAVFQKAGMSYTLLQCRTEEEVIAQCREGEILINQYAPMTERVLRHLPVLKLIIRYGVGYNNIDVEAATRLGIQVCNIPDYGTDEVAHHAFALMLALTRKITVMNRRTKEVGWDYTYAIPIQRYSEMTVGVVGLGRIGRTFAGLAQGLGCRVIGYDPYYTPNETDGTKFIQPASFEELVKASDVISIHCPYTPDLFCRETFQAMKSSAVLINVARGGIVNERDLDEALESGEIAGAGLDCMEREPMPPNSPIFRHETLLCTPHMAWYSQQSSADLKRKVAEQAVLFASGQPVAYPVNQIQVLRSNNVKNGKAV